MSLSKHAKRQPLPGTSWLDILQLLPRTEVAKMELSNSRFGRIVGEKMKVLPLHQMEEIRLIRDRQTDECRIDDRASVNLPREPSQDSAWRLFCQLLRRISVGNVKFFFLDFTAAVQEWDDARRDGQITTTDGRVTLHCIGCNNAAAVVGGPDVVLSELTRIHEILMQNYINSTR